ncbi:Pyridoxal kinase PdxY [Candidatus Profftia lariciata]|uniref:pyridoxal kinase PdxY n=1 Tax=Candidatus Profftia lariciata TaxID=1987921 RepID=UPI001D007E4B|nr:pyridoxal kinase PdxY [Candidatus Profftia lariciata]UDG81308.1 Pyridoxal kinase PdxY [Candidatus Profftia lariciata]
MKNILSIQSHVVFGHAGNSSAVFPMRRMGVNVWPLNTVQFSNHTQYGQWTGIVMPANHLTEIVQGIAGIDQLKNCDAILSGYIGSPEQGRHILDIVRTVKNANSNAWYFCDPVMGHPEKGCLVAPGIADFFAHDALKDSDIIAPNLLELERLSGSNIKNVKEALIAARNIIANSSKIVLIKHLACAGYDKNSFEMILVTVDQAWHIHRPLVDFGEHHPVGVGDLTSGLLLVGMLQGKSLKEALEYMTAAVYEVILITKKMCTYELQVVAAQDRMVKPIHKFIAIAI